MRASRDGERFTRETVAAAQAILTAAMQGDRARFDVLLENLRQDLHARVTVTAFALFAANVVLKDRRRWPVIGINTVKIAVRWVVRRPSYDHLLPLTAARLDVLAEAVAAGPFADLVDPPLLHALLHRPLGTLDDGTVDRHHPAFLVNAHLAAAALFAVSVPQQKASSAFDLISAIGLGARARRLGVRRAALLDGLGLQPPSPSCAP